MPRHIPRSNRRGCSFKTMKQDPAARSQGETLRQPRERETGREKNGERKTVRDRSREEEREGGRERERERPAEREGKRELIPSLPPTTKRLSCHYSCRNIMGVGLRSVPRRKERVLLLGEERHKPSPLANKDYSIVQSESSGISRRAVQEARTHSLD